MSPRLRGDPCRIACSSSGIKRARGKTRSKKWWRLHRQVQENLPPRARGIGVFVTFFHALKSAGVPVTLREYLTLMEAMEEDLASRRIEGFYYLSRAALIKDERNLDK